VIPNEIIFLPLQNKRNTVLIVNNKRAFENAIMSHLIYNNRKAQLIYRLDREEFVLLEGKILEEWIPVHPIKLPLYNRPKWKQN